MMVLPAWLAAGSCSAQLPTERTWLVAQRVMPALCMLKSGDQAFML